MATKKTTRDELEAKRKRAESLFKAGSSQKEIAEIVKVSQVTIVRWAKNFGWKEQRAAETISRPQLVNKLLTAIDNLIEKVNESNDPMALAGIGDKLSKFAATIDKLDKKANVVDVLEVCTAFSKWLQFRLSIDSELSVDLVKTINKYQDLFVADQINQKL